MKLGAALSRVARILFENVADANEALLWNKNASVF